MPEEAEKRAEIRRRIKMKLFSGGRTSTRGYVVYLKVKQAMSEVHEGICGGHQAGPKMSHKLQQLGYDWPTMSIDCNGWAKSCHQCQIHISIETSSAIDSVLAVRSLGNVHCGTVLQHLMDTDSY